MRTRTDDRTRRHEIRRTQQFAAIDAVRLLRIVQLPAAWAGYLFYGLHRIKEGLFGVCDMHFGRMLTFRSSPSETVSAGHPDRRECPFQQADI